jgi:hypothetical protein
MQRLYKITLKVDPDHMAFSKVPAIKALRHLTGMELKSAVALIDIVISAGINNPIEQYLDVCDDGPIIDNAIANFNRTGFTIEYLGDKILDDLNALHKRSIFENNTDAEKAILKVIEFYKS